MFYFIFLQVNERKMSNRTEGTGDVEVRKLVHSCYTILLLCFASLLDQIAKYEIRPKQRESAVSGRVVTGFLCV